MDDVIDLYKQDVDRGLLREALKLTPTDACDASWSSLVLPRGPGLHEEGGSVTDFERLLQALAAGSVEYILIGAAANAHGAIRTTRDVDIVYARSQANLERLEKTLAPLRPSCGVRRRDCRSDWMLPRCTPV